MFKKVNNEESYNGSELVTAIIEYQSFDEAYGGHYCRKNGIRYIFRRFNDKGVTKYLDVLHKFVFTENENDIKGHLVDIIPFTDYYPDLANVNIPILAIYKEYLSDINIPCQILKKDK